MNAIEDIRTNLVPVVAELTNEFFLDTVTLKERRSPRQDALGQETEAAWEDVDNMVDLRALILTATEYAERVSDHITLEVGDYVIMLGSYQTGINNKMRVDDGSVTYEVFGWENDPTNLITRLFCRLSDPGTASA